MKKSKKFELIYHLLQLEAVMWLKSNVKIPKVQDNGDRSWPFYRDSKGELRYMCSVSPIQPTLIMPIKG